MAPERGLPVRAVRCVAGDAACGVLEHHHNHEHHDDRPAVNHGAALDDHRARCPRLVGAAGVVDGPRACAPAGSGTTTTLPPAPPAVPVPATPAFTG